MLGTWNSLLLIDVEKSDADRLICRQKESKFGKIDEFSNQLQPLIYGLNFFIGLFCMSRTETCQFIGDESVHWANNVLDVDFA